MAYTADGKTLVGFTHSGIILWDIRAGKEIRRTIPLNDNLSQIAFSPEGKSLLCHTWRPRPEGGVLRCWDIATGRECATISLPRHWEEVALSPDGRTVAMVPMNFGTTDFWEIATGQKRLELAVGRDVCGKEPYHREREHAEQEPSPQRQSREHYSSSSM